MPMRTRNVTRPADFDTASNRREPGTDRTFRIVFMRLGVAEINQHPIAHVLRHKAVETGDCVRDRVVIGVDEVAQILRVKLRR